MGLLVPLILVSCMFVITLGLFVTYIILDHNHFQVVEQTIRESPIIIESVSNLSVVHNRAVQESPKKPQLAGLIVETRDHPNLIPVIDNFKSVLPGVPIYAFHGISNEHKLKERYGEENMFYINIDSDDLTIRQYNYLLTLNDLWKNIHAEHVLVFQTDSVLFTASDVKIEDYFQYDYVGAPWTKMYGYYARNAFMFRGLDKHTWAGNGGLSLRKCETMEKVTRTHPYLSIPYAPEDVYFSNALHYMKDIKLPVREVAASLFYESIESDTMPLGAHKYIPEKFRDKIKAEELAIIESYN